MKKSLIISALLWLLPLSNAFCADDGSLFSVAHRGCTLAVKGEFYINENCPDGVRMARRFGYPAVEMDVKYTSDKVLVVMHDKTINRTMRLADGYAEIPEPVEVEKTPFDTLRKYYVLASTDPALRKPIPTLEEMLLACRQEGIVAMLHSSIEESYRMAEKILGKDGWIAFNSNESALRKARACSDCLVLMDPRLGESDAVSTVTRLKSIGGRCGMSTMKHEMLDAAYISRVRDAGFEVQASIFPVREAQRAAKDGITLQLSDTWWYQTEGRRPDVVWEVKDKTLAAGEKLNWKSALEDFAGVTLELEFTGNISINFSGKAKYIFSHEKAGVERMGVRLYKGIPSVQIIASGDARILSAKACVYRICGGERKMVVINPGHSHASIAQSEMHPGFSDTVRVFAPECPEIHEYLSRIERMNTRKKNPTAWVEEVYVGDDYLEKVPKAGKGDFAVLANKNNCKSELILKAVELGYNVLADKPMAIVPEDLPLLEKAYALAEEKGLVIFDMMTERYNVTNAVCRQLASDEAFFGGITEFHIDNVHHFLKPSGGKTLVRPAWYYDINQQGEGIADVSTHYLDLAFWQCRPGKSIEKGMIKGLKASHNPTVITPEQFTKSTECPAFPDFLAGAVRGGNLEVMCNGAIDFKMDGIKVGVDVRWDYVAPEGGGDLFAQVIKGRKATLRILQEKSTGFKRVLYVETKDAGAAEAAFARLQNKMPYVSFEQESPGRYKMKVDTKKVPSDLFGSACVLSNFLRYLDDPASFPSWEVPNTLTKYYVTTLAVRQVSK